MDATGGGATQPPGNPAKHDKRLVDFDRVNRREVRLSLGAVNVKTGNSVYFDDREIEIHCDHVRASGSLPPTFAPIEIEGDYYWDGGIVSNTPFWYVLDDSPRMDALIIQVDLFSAIGEIPSKFDQVLEREKDIQYSSKTRFNTLRVQELAELRTTLKRLLQKLPPELAEDPDVQELSAVSEAGKITIAHLINRRLSLRTMCRPHSSGATPPIKSRRTMLAMDPRALFQWCPPSFSQPCLPPQAVPKENKSIRELVPAR